MNKILSERSENLKYVIAWVFFTFMFGKATFCQTYQVKYIQSVVIDSTKTLVDSKTSISTIWTLIGEEKKSFYYTKGKNYSNYSNFRQDSCLLYTSPSPRD